jgi:hypothetical protein
VSILSLKKFRLLDILIFTFVAVLIDIVVGIYGLLGLKLFFSIGIPIVLLLYIRWGKYALIANIIIVIVHFVVHYVNIYVMIAHSIGLFSLSFAIVLVKWDKLQKRNVEFQYVFVYFIFLYLTMLLVEWILLLIFNQYVNLFAHLLNHSLNMLLSILILSIISKQNDLIINMNNYLRDQTEGD